MSRPLGDGSAALCDADPPVLGGVPATDPLEFGTEPDVLRAINDLGCRAVDGRGMLLGRLISGACTRLLPAGGIGFVSTQASTQFCIPIAHAWAFPGGETVVAARVRDLDGEEGAPAEIVVRIPPVP